MFADKIMETITPAGTGAYQLAGPPAGSAYGTWRSKFATATVVGYFASNAAGTKWEMGYGTLTYGSPDTLSRNLFAGTNSSSTGSLISWASGDSPVNVYSVPIGVMMAHLVSGGLLSTRPAWAQAGLGWLDYTIGLATTWVKKRWTGTVDIEEGRFDIAAGIFTPSPRNKWVDNGAVNLTMLATHVGQVILFDCSAAARTFTALAGATAGIGHGFTVWVEGYGSTVNGVVLAPNGSEKIDQGAAGASLTIPPNRLTRLSWDGAKSQWRTDYTPAPAWAGVRQTVAAGPVDTAGLPTFLPATSGSFTLTGQNVSSSAPLVAAAGSSRSRSGLSYLFANSEIRRVSISKPTTSKPARPNEVTTGKPTYPKPRTEMCRRMDIILGRSSRRQHLLFRRCGHPFPAGRGAALPAAMPGLLLRRELE